MTTTIKHGPMYPIGSVKGANGLLKEVRQLFPQVEAVADSNQAVKVLVRKGHIAQATPGNPAKCAMAIASCKLFNATGAYVGRGTSYLVFGKLALRFLTPASVYRELVSFDRHDDFREGAYGLSAIYPSYRLNRKRKCKRGPHTTTEKPKKRLTFQGHTLGVRSAA